MAGLFFSWSCAVTAGLGKLPDAAYLAAMQSINRTILNPLFFSCFFGSALLLPLSAWQAYGVATPLRFWLLLGAAACYLTGVMGVTIFGNVPMNDALDAFKMDHASAEVMARQRAAFETRWNALNNLRTVASTAAVVLLGLAFFQRPMCSS
jgi:uncharacterized membrane protein